MANADFVTRITLQNQEFQNEIKRCQSEIKNLKNTSADSAIGVASMAKSFAKFAGVGLGIGTVVGGIKDFADSSIDAYRNIEMLRTSFTTLLGSASQADSLVNSLRDYGANSPYDTEGLARAAQVMLGYGMNAQQLMPTLKQLGDVAMGDNNKLQSLALAFSQMEAAGKVCKQDLNQMVNAGFNPLQQIAEKTGKSIGELNEEVSNGAISVHDIEQAFKEATSKGGKFYNMSQNMSDTLNGKLASLNDEWSTLKQTFGELIAPAVMKGVASLTSIVKDLADALYEVKRAIKKLSSGVDTKVIDNVRSGTQRGLDYANNKEISKEAQARIDKLKTPEAREKAYNKERQKVRLAALNKGKQYTQNAIGNTKRQLANLDNQQKEQSEALNYKSPNWSKERADKAKKNFMSNEEYRQQRATLQAKIKELQERYKAYDDATQINPFETTKKDKDNDIVNIPKTPKAKEKIIPSGSLADLENQLKQAQEVATNAVGMQAYQAAMKTVDEIQKNIDKFKMGIDWEYQTQDISDLPKQTKTQMYKIDFEVSKTDGLKKLQETLDEINTEKIDATTKALSNLGNINITSYESVRDSLKGIGDITDKNTKGAAAMGASMQMMGQALVQLGQDGETAKVGLVMSALGQIAVSFAQAMNSTKNWYEWLAFGISGTAVLISMVSQLQSFSQGGIINGGSTSGDQMLARVNGGEMILNGTQQKKLFNLLDSNGAVGNSGIGHVDFVIDGKVLRGVLKNYDNKMSILK